MIDAKLKESIKKLQAIKNKANVDLAKSLEKLFTSYFREVSKNILSGKLLDTSLDAAGRAKVINELNTYLVNAGYKDFIQSYYDRFPQITNEVKNYFEVMKQTPTLAKATQEGLTTWIKQTEYNLKKKLDSKLVDPLQNLIIQNQIGMIDRETVAMQIAGIEEKLSYKDSLQVVNDYIAQYQRMNQVAFGDELNLEVYIYVGPEDDITSEQCQDLLAYDKHGLEGAAYKDEINSDMVKGLKGNPLFDGGHPNCRHHYLPVTLEYAKSLGFKA